MIIKNKKTIIIMLTLIVFVVACIGGALILRASNGVSKELNKGDYRQAYNNAKSDKEKEEISTESILTHFASVAVNKFAPGSAKAEFLDIWYNKKEKKIVYAIKNDNAKNYLLFTLSGKDINYKFVMSYSEKNEEESTEEISAYFKYDKYYKNNKKQEDILADSEAKKIINKVTGREEYKVKNNVVKRINHFYEEGKLKNPDKLIMVGRTDIIK